MATELSTFLGRYDDKRDAFWTALLEDRVEGSITIDGINAESQGAHLISAKFFFKTFTGYIYAVQGCFER